MPAMNPYRFRYEEPEKLRVHYSKGINRYCIQKVHRDHVFFRCDASDEPMYAMPMPDEVNFDRLVLP